MKILEVNKLYHPWRGGVETVVQDIAEGLNNVDNTTVDVLVCGLVGDRHACPDAVEAINNVKIFHAKSWGMFLGMPLSLDFFRQFKKLINNYDIIIIHQPFPLACLAQWLYGRNHQIYIWYHSDIVRQRLSKWLFYPFLISSLRQAAKIFTASNNLVKNSRILQKFSNKCRVISFGIDESLLSSVNQEKSNQILAVGRLVYYKGFEYLIDAFALHCRDRARPVRLLIIGAGPLKDKLNQQINKLNLQDKVKIIPPVPDLTPYFQASDIFVFPSCEPSEAFGIVQLEAMAAGLPVINTDLPTGVPEVSLNNITGLTVPIKNAPALAEAINRLINDKELRLKLGRQARQRVQENFTKKIFLEKLRQQI